MQNQEEQGLKSQDLSFINKILKPEYPFFWMSVIYTLAISFISLAIPLSVQFLINSVSFTAMARPTITLGFVLLILLIFLGFLNALQFFITEIFQRRFFIRSASEIALLVSRKREKSDDKIEINHFFETITIQKIIPKFLTKTFSTLLQGAIGLILVSFYHPIFFAFSAIIAISLWLIWKGFYRQAIANSLAKSKNKYEIVKCLEHISEKPNDLNDLKKIDILSKNYLESRKKRFSYLFFQVILLLLLYAFASVALLIIGGFLVLNNQLTIGQLVAAELILSAILYNFSQLGRDLENFYDLSASCYKLSKFYDEEITKHDLEKFKTINEIEVVKPLKILPKLIIIFLILTTLILCLTPWQQTSKGIGHVIASNPNDRAQNINSPISGRIKKWFVKDGQVVKKDDKIAEIIDNDPQILERIKSERDAKKRKLEVSEIAASTGKINYERQQNLFEKGLSSRKDFEEAKIEYKKLLAIKESAASELAESETKLSRQENQIILAPKDGVVLKVLAGDLATTVKQGDKIATFAPNLNDPAIEIYVSGNDIPLVIEGRKVRLQFEGWPIIQFSGWPSLAIGTFGGVVSSVDSSISENGKFRVIVKKDQNENWPDERFLRHGAKTQAWILLNNVSLGYELWRQLNSFPPSFDSELKFDIEKSIKHDKNEK